jgi:hypothetical protein
MSTDVVELDETTPEPVQTTRAPLFALWTFVAVELGAFILCVTTARDAWFIVDDWDFLAARGLSVHDILLPHGGHLVAIPMLVYRLLFTIFGLRTYAPYQLVVIGAHLAVAALLRALMRREGVNPWIATAAASVIVLFGSGIQDITSAFQITFTGAVAFGLAQLLLADHEGGLDRRDWLGLGAGLCALSCSGVGLAMVGIVGIATLVRRGWRIASFHVVPLLVVFEIWLHVDESTNNLTTKDATTLARWTWRGMRATFNSLGRVPTAGWLLAAMLIVGLGLAARSWPSSERRRRAAIPLAFVAGAIGFLVFTGYGRAWSGLQNAATGRYLYIYAVMFVTPLAIAADALVRRWRVLLLPVLALLLVGVPGNVSEFTRHVYATPTASALRSTLLSLPRMELAQRVPEDTLIDPYTYPGVTVGWLLSGAREGWLPKPSGPPTPVQIATNTLRLTLSQSLGAHGPRCEPLKETTELNLDPGSSLRVHGTVAVQLVTDDGASVALLFGNVFGAGLGDHTLHASVQPLHLRIFPKTVNAGVC